MTEYQPGDVVNGHVFTGTEWVPVRNLEPPPAAAVTYPELLPTPGQPWQIGNTQGGKVWTGSSWQPGTGAFYDGKRWQPTFDFVGMREQDAPTAKTQKRNKIVDVGDRGADRRRGDGVRVCVGAHAGVHSIR